MMKKLEIKVAISDFGIIPDILKDYYVGILNQTDTYFIVNDGQLKIERRRYWCLFYSLLSSQYWNRKRIKLLFFIWYHMLIILASTLSQEIIIKRQHYLYEKCKKSFKYSQWFGEIHKN